jgi:hypothetical protein
MLPPPEASTREGNTKSKLEYRYAHHFQMMHVLCSFGRVDYLARQGAEKTRVYKRLYKMRPRMSLNAIQGRNETVDDGGRFESTTKRATI